HRPAGGATGGAGPVDRGRAAAGQRARCGRVRVHRTGSKGRSTLMALFRRKRAPEAADTTADAQPTRQAPEEEAPEPQDEANQDLIGPWDISEEPELGNRVDLGALRVPKRPGLQVRMEVDKKSRRVVAVNLSLDGSALQLQAFAAPRSEGLRDGLREELQTQISKQGGSASIKTGVFGEELLARLPVRLPDGRKGHRPARLRGVAGPRWLTPGALARHDRA